MVASKTNEGRRKGHPAERRTKVLGRNPQLTEVGSGKVLIATIAIRAIIK
jgi:hypothetical protein